MFSKTILEFPENRLTGVPSRQRLLGMALTFLAALSVVIPHPVGAEPLSKHPRVAELEDKLNKDGSAYLKSRFPDQPFLVTSSVDPIRRDGAGRTGSNKSRQASEDDLPFFDMQESEDAMMDEWDDPNLSLNQLMLRTKKILIQVSLPNTISDEETAEVKDSLTQILHLTPARDDVQVTKRAWKTAANSTPPTPDYSKYIYAFAGVIAAAFLVISLLTRASINRLAKVVAEGAGAGGTAQQAAAAPPTVNVSIPSNDGMNGGSRSLEGNFQVSDASKIREQVGIIVDRFVHDQNFPLLQDMILLDRFAHENLPGMGALLHEFPQDVRAKLLALGTAQVWLDATHKAGMLDPASVRVLSAMARISREGIDPIMEGLLIRIWRLDMDEKVKLFKSLSPEEAFAILDWLPRSISIPTARRAFPGSWGTVLSGSGMLMPLSPERVQDIADLAERIHPLTSLAMIEEYRRDMELLEFLKTSEFEEERDIYAALKPDSIIFRVRPSFASIFQISPQGMSQLVQKFTPSQLALALFGVPRDERMKVEAALSEKQKFVLEEELRRLDQAVPPKDMVARIREQIARAKPMEDAPPPFSIKETRDEQEEFKNAA